MLINGLDPRVPVVSYHGGYCDLDCETRSECDLTETGGWVYSLHPTTEVLALCYRLPGDPISLWTPNGPVLDDAHTATLDMVPREMDLEYLRVVNPIPERLRRWVESGMPIRVWNRSFETSIWLNVLTRRYGWPLVEPVNQVQDAMEASLYFSFPASVERAAHVVMDGAIEKNMEGNRIMRQLCAPRKPTARDQRKWDCDRTKYLKLWNYCADDVAAQHAIASKLGFNPLHVAGL